MKAQDFANKAMDIVKNHKTVYMWGSFGNRLTASFIDQKRKQYPLHYTAKKVEALKQKTSGVWWAFDCVGLIKGILWGWSAKGSSLNGGAKYPNSDMVAAGVCPDINANDMISNYCYDVSKDFSKIEVGEVVWLPGHIGIYIGSGFVIEASPKWADGVQITALGNIGKCPGYNSREWRMHGKLKFIDYPPKVKPVENSVEGVENMPYYEKLSDVPKGEMRDVVDKLIKAGAIKGTGTGLHLSEDMVRVLVYNDRMGLYK